MTLALGLLVVLPFVVGGLLVLLQRAADPAAGVLAVGTAIVTLGLAGLVAAGRPAAEAAFLPGQPLVLRVDGLAALVLVVVAVVTLGVVVAGTAEIQQSQGRFFGLLLVFLAAVLLTVTAGSLLTLLLGWEVMGATSYALIAFRWREDGAAGSGLTAFLTTRAGDLGLYAAAGAALAGAGRLDYTALPRLTGWPLHLAAAGVLAAALGKAAQLPFSFWLARAMQGPSAVSALLHSAAMVAMGGYLLLRLSPLLGAPGWAGPVAAGVGLATALLLGLVALAQSDLKLLLAASTASQLGFVVLAAGLGATAAGAAHLVAHAFVKSALFLVAGALLELLGTRDLHRLRGAARRVPDVGVAAVVGLLTLAGLPPLALWATKDGVLAAALERSPALYAAGLLAAALSAGYAGRALGLLLRGGAPEDHPEPAPAAAVWPPVLLAAGGVGLGALALPVVRDGLDRLVGTAGVPPRAAELVLSAAVALLVAAAAFGTATASPAWAPAAVRDWLHLERAAHLLAVRPVLALARALALADDRLLARGLDRAGAGAVALARAARAGDERGVDGAVRRVGEGTAALGRRLPRLQTGQLHHYLAQASAVLAVAVVLLLVRG